MSPTQTQLRTLGKFTWGSAQHRVVDYSVTTETVREGVNHDLFNRHTYTIKTELQGSSLADLQSKLNSLKSDLLTAEDFTLERSGQVVYAHTTAECHYGPVARINADGREQHGTIESLIITVTAVVPVSVSGGLIDHQYAERTRVDTHADLLQTVRGGKVITASGSSAKTWIESNLPAQPPGYDRTLEIATDDTDTSATYTLTDSETIRRNFDASVKDHQYTATEVTDRGVLTQKLRSGRVEMHDGNSAKTFMLANLPATTPGFIRTYRIDNADDDLTGTYQVTDTLREGASWPPGIDRAELKTTVAIDDQHRQVTTKAGFFIGSSAQAEVDAVKATMVNLISQSETIDTYDDGRIAFNFVGVESDDASDITFWSETIQRSAGGRTVRASIYADRPPFIWNSAQQPEVFSVTGRAVSIKKSGSVPQWVVPPAPPSGFADFQSGLTDVQRTALTETEFQTTWRMTFIMAPGTSLPAPRDKSGATFSA